MNVRELIDELEMLDAPDAEVRLAFQPNYPLQYHVGDVAIDEGHRHAPEPDGDAWYCADPDCEKEWNREPRDFELGGDDAEASGVVYIGERGQVYDAPYLPGSAAQALGWSR